MSHDPTPNVVMKLSRLLHKEKRSSPGRAGLQNRGLSTRLMVLPGLPLRQTTVVALEGEG